MAPSAQIYFSGLQNSIPNFSDWVLLMLLHA